MSAYLTNTNNRDLSKFSNPMLTIDGNERATVSFSNLETLWFNTGTLCNLECVNCYIESSPVNDRLAYITATEVQSHLQEIKSNSWNTQEIGFTGGEPFMNPEIIECLESCLIENFNVLVLTNGMRPMMKLAEPLLLLKETHGEKVRIRISLDHYQERFHKLERGNRSWEATLIGLKWLTEHKFNVNVAGRTCWEEQEDSLRQGYRKLFFDEGIEIDAYDNSKLILFPEMDETVDVPEISAHCWDILNVNPKDIMCATSRMVVKRKGANHTTVLPCTLLPYDRRFEMGNTLVGALGKVVLNHPHCAKFCVLGGGTCSIPT